MEDVRHEQRVVSKRVRAADATGYRGEGVPQKQEPITAPVHGESRALVTVPSGHTPAQLCDTLLLWVEHDEAEAAALTTNSWV